MADIELIGVPFDGYGRAGHQARAASALRAAGLCDAFDHHHVIDDDDLTLPAPDPAGGGSTSLSNEHALTAMTDALNRKVGEVVNAGRFPFVYGGDCSTLLGIVTGLRDHVGDVGLVFINGHIDANQGSTPRQLTDRMLSVQQGGRLPALRPEQLVILGPRDEHRVDPRVWLAPIAEVADDPVGTGRQAIEELSAHVDRWWLHIDLDVLDPAESGAQTLPDLAAQSGGLTWDQLTDLTSALFTGPGSCVGGSLAAYDPDQDPSGTEAAQIVTFIRNVLVRPTISP